MIIVTIICATGVFTMLTVSILMEAKQLNVDIRRYPSNDGLDNLIFRYQVGVEMNLEQSVGLLVD